VQRRDYLLLSRTISAARLAILRVMPINWEKAAGCDVITRAIAEAIYSENKAFDRHRFLQDCGILLGEGPERPLQ
jgi:hypothetical protein